MLGRILEAVVVLCAVIGLYAILAVIGLFSDATLTLVLAVLGSFGCYLYGRYGRRLLGGDAR
ncbi:hypothetical protein [Paracraurococcus ruber]|uniref:Uncharacterized protein n=1 Tax=Paracraurococcus ruber TaxID=77675 RepID=A0ABS1D6V0_9PROT|nr:hypothetical protein [Paracraurococcus ruber]MBK1662458.1 hypothetical protein [Paracraurococcus ruber]TDG27174.1 hypothetical protein E2C05_23790 [Paracraurococcus ruber]